MNNQTPQTPKTPKLNDFHIKYLIERNKYFPAVYSALNWQSDGSDIIIDEHNGKKRFYHPGNKDKGLPSNSSEKGYSARLIFNKIQSAMYFVEGETDFACCVENGIENVITGTGGCNTFKKEWINELKEKNINTIYFCYDNDIPGKSSSLKHATELAEQGIQTFLLQWPQEFSNKEDVRDLFQVRKMNKDGVLNFLHQNSIEISQQNDPKDKTKKERINDTVLTVGRFYRTKNGWFASGEKNDIFISASFEVLTQVRSKNQDGWSLLIRFQDDDSQTHDMCVSLKDIYNKSTIETLIDNGLRVSTASKGKELLAELLMLIKVPDRARLTDNNGFQENACYVTPIINLGICDEKYIYDSQSAYSLKHKTQGTIESWAKNIGIFIAGNSNLVLACGTVFAAPLLRFMGKENFGFNFYGPSSKGKTTTLEVAASIVGSAEKYPKGLTQSWRTTSNALESIAKAHNDSTLFLDEMGEAEPKAVSEAAYFLGNGQGKSRANKTGEAQDRKSFKLTYLSTSEVTLQGHLNSKGLDTKAGQAIRCLDIKSLVSETNGAFETLHQFQSSAELVAHIKNATKLYCGSVYQRYIEKLSHEINENPDEFKNKINNYINGFVNRITMKKKSSYHQRIVNNFALVYAANFLALEYDCLPLSEKENFSGLSLCLDRVFEQIGWEHFEKSEIIKTVKYFLEKHSLNRFIVNDSSVLPLEDRNKISQNAAGVRHSYNTHDCFCIFPEVFKSEVVPKFDHRNVCSVLKESGFLITDLTSGKNSISIPSFGLQKRVYAVKTSILEWSEDNDENSVSGVLGVL